MNNFQQYIRNVSQTSHIMTHLLKKGRVFPNNDTLPLLVYQGALHLPGQDPSKIFEALFAEHQWGDSWRNGVYNFHHYHSTAHEVLGVYGGNATIQLGGQHGVILSVNCGDVIIIPAGVAHKNLGSTYDFRVVGAYPIGQEPDMCYGNPAERPEADQNIAKIPLPALDPVYGSDGPLIEYWYGQNM